MAVYTPVSEQDLKQHLTAFDIGAVRSFSGIASGVSNTNYLLETTRGKYILTLFESRTRAEDLPFCLGFMEYLSEKGIPAPAVVADRAGRKIAPLAGKLSAITTFLQGASVEETTAPLCAEAGRLLARMHMAGKDFPMKHGNGMGISEWKKLVAACRGKTDISMFEQEISFLEENSPPDLPSGAIHADLFPDNIFFESKKLSGVIDFYFACTDCFAYDLMLTVNAWCFDKKGVLYKDKAAALLNAYKAVRPLDKKEQESLPLLGRTAAVRIASTRLYDSLHMPKNALVTPKDPREPLAILRFHQTEKIA